MQKFKRKKVYIMAVVLAVCFIAFPEMVRAAEPDTDKTTESQPDGQETEAANAGLLTLDDRNVYKGMKKAYKDGYIPVVSKDKVKIVLPVCCLGDLKPDSIQAQLDLGALENSPFVYKNYSKTVKKTREKINGSKKEKEIFLVEFSVGLQDKRLNGTYPVIMNLSYPADGEWMAQSFTVYVRITDGRENMEEGGNADEPEPASEPKVIVEKCSYSVDKIVSGSVFTGTVTFRNTSKSKYIQNITVTVISDTPGISLCSDGNVFYSDKVDENSTWELPLEIKVDQQVPEGRYNMRFSVSYDNPEAASLSSEGQISFPVYQTMKVELETGEMASEVTAGDSITLPVQVMNLGRSMIYNVRCKVEGTGLSSPKSLFIGNLEGGTAGSGELTLFAGMVNADAEKEDERYGSASGNIIMLYEDAEGHVYTEKREYHTNIAPLVIKNTGVSGKTKEEKMIGKQMMAGAMIVLLISAGLCVVLIVLKRRKERLSSECDEQENV